jgi:glycine/D-amino acid oxidase-like deaminating enzyme
MGIGIEDEAADVVVIGGGLAGCATAYYLAADGVDVLLVEKGDLNTFASGSNAGSLHAQIPHEPFVQNGERWAEVFAPTVALLARSIEMWRGLPELLGATDLEVSLKGGLLVAPNEAQMRDIERKALVERGQGLEIELLDRAALRARAPYLSEAMFGGAFCAGEGKANPLAVAPAFAAAATRAGARIRRNREVSAIERTGPGFSVVTSKGTIAARRVVDAAGADAGRVAAMVGAKLSVDGHAIQVSVSERIAPLVPHLVYFTGGKLTLKQNAAGSLLIGGGWPARWSRSGRPVTDPVNLASNMAIAASVVPALADVRIVRTWAAIVNGTDDWKPIFGEMPGVPGFFVNFFPWMGFTAGPAAARITASLVQGKTPPINIDLAPFLMG